ncbi:N-acetyltransferase family protein [Streptomyces sp. NPDC001073]
MKIVTATVADIEVLSRMIGEVEAYYGGEYVAGNTETIRAALFGPLPPAATVLIARDNDEALGFASYSSLWPAAGADVSFYLKELFVREQHRRRGVGGHLLDAVEAATAAAGWSRLEWTGDADNPAALGFYKARGARQHRGKIVYRAEISR